MTILFVGNTPADVGLTSAVFSTAATGRDSAYSPSSVLCKNTTPIINIGVDGGTTFWFHWRMHLSNVSSGSGTASGTLFQIYDGNSNLVADGIKNTNVYEIQARAYGSSTVTGSIYALRDGTTYFVDVAVTVGGSGGTIRVEIYINGVLVSFAQATNSGTVKTQPRQCQIPLPNRIDSGATGIYFTEFLVTSDEPTLNLRVATLEPTSAGNYAQWAGTVASLSDVDTGSGITTGNSNNRFTTIFGAYGGSSVPAGVRGLILKATPQINAGGPTRLDQPVRISSVDYDGSGVVISGGTPQMREMALNPATSAPWLTSAFASLEAGVRSVA